MMNNHKKLEEMISCALNNSGKPNAGFSFDQIQWLCTNAHKIFLSEPSLLDLTAPINICGDLHGQFHDLLKALNHGGLPPTTKWLFLGDYVDRGSQGLEVMCLLLALKIRYPNNIYLIRGNHETEEISGAHGFCDECKIKIGKGVWSMFCSVFDTLPIGALINKKIFCIHGGLSPHLNEVKQILSISRPTKIPSSGLLTDLLWSDPDPCAKSFETSPRGNTVIWGHKTASKFMMKNSLKMIIRGHQVADAGYAYPLYPSKDVITLFTASNHSGKANVDAAYMKIQSDLSYSFSVLLENSKRKLVKRMSLAVIDINIGKNKDVMKNQDDEKYPTMIRRRKRRASTNKIERVGSGIFKLSPLLSSFS